MASPFKQMIQSAPLWDCLLANTYGHALHAKCKSLPKREHLQNIFIKQYQMFARMVMHYMCNACTNTFILTRLFILHQCNAQLFDCRHKQWRLHSINPPSLLCCREIPDK